MRIEVLADPGEVARRAADAICATVRATPDAVLGLPTGTTPVPMYAELARRAAASACDLSRAAAFAIDEFCDATADTPGTNSAYYRCHVRLGLQALRCPDPAAPDPDAHIAAFADEIRRAGGFGLCVLGIGVNGHIAFNEPGSSRESRARVVRLEEISRQAYAAAFGSPARVPSRGMTLGIADLLEARAILVLATGAAKAAIARAAIAEPPASGVPASWLREHRDVTWLLDREAAALLRP
jgi:glucosamine-6-phosphate deaminase